VSVNTAACVFAIALLIGSAPDRPYLCYSQAISPSPDAEQIKSRAEIRSEGWRQSYEQFALTHRGDVQRGRELFTDDKTARCAACHRVDGQGGEMGPDLSHIGGKFDRIHLIESLLEPSRQIVEGYRRSSIQTLNGQMVVGVVKRQYPDSVEVFDANGLSQTISRQEIEEIVEDSVSAMPDGLVDSLSPEQFGDLIAYLESLRPGGKLTPGEGIRDLLTVPDEFEVRVIATGLTGCTALETLPDGRILVCQQTGELRVVKAGQLLPTPLLELEVDDTWERGLIGVTVDPQFPDVPYVYACYVARDPFPHHRISRFTAVGDVAKPSSEIILLRGDDQRKLGGNVPAGHQGGGLHFGADGRLYVGIGEQTAEMPAQALDSLLGKILRINPDGTIPQDNPWVGQTSGKYCSIWARGLRNPFTFAVEPVSGQLFINDVGGQFEEINRGVAGANYGWPIANHGPNENQELEDPIHYYPEASISGGAFPRPDTPWPDQYRHRYFFADFVLGTLNVLDPRNPGDVSTFAAGLRRPVDLRFGSDHCLYVLLRNAWVRDDKFANETGSLLRIEYRGQ
jgi:putative heme-binding domain-containing protein